MHDQWPIWIGNDDFERLSATAAAHRSEAHPLVDELASRLGRARVCRPDDLPSDVVSLDTFVEYEQVGHGKARRALICPEDRLWPPCEISVLSRLGLALLGRRIGDRTETVTVDGRGSRVLVTGLGPRMQSGIVRIALSTLRR